MSSSSTPLVSPPSHPSVSVLSEVFADEKEDTKRSFCAEVGLLADTELDSLILKIAHKLATNQNSIIISQSSSSAPSSSSSVVATAPQSGLNMTELRRLLEEEKKAGKVSFRADLKRRVELLVESVFKRMTNKTLELDLARLDSGNGASAGGDRAQAVGSADGRTESSPRVSPIITQPSTCSSSSGQSCSFISQPMGPVCNCSHPPKRTVLPEVKEEDEEDTSKMNSTKDTQLLVSKVKEEEDEDDQDDGLIRGGDHSQVDTKRYEVTQPNVDCGQLLSNPSRDRQNASNANESIEEGGTNLSSEQRLNTANQSVDRTVTQSGGDLFSPSTSTGLGLNRAALNQQATVSTGRNETKRKQTTSNLTGKRSKKTLQEEDGDDGEDIANEDREEAKVKVLYLNCTVSNCNAKLDSLDHLHVHLSTVHGLAPLRCFATNCNARFDNRRQVGDHIKLSHPRSTRFDCSVCPTECDSQIKANTHWYKCHLTGQFQCNFVSDCGEVTDTRRKMATHQKAKHRSQSKHFH